MDGSPPSGSAGTERKGFSGAWGWAGQICIVYPVGVGMLVAQSLT